MAVFPKETFITGAGNNQSGGTQSAGYRNAFRLRFPNLGATPGLAAHPRLELWQTTNPTVPISANADTIFPTYPPDLVPATGDSAIIALATNGLDDNDTLGSNVPVDWATGAALGTSYATTARVLYGDQSYLPLLDAGDPLLSGANDNVPFNLTMRVHSNADTNVNAQRGYIIARYSFTGGTDPGVIFEGNNGGSDSSPAWASLAGDDPAIGSDPDPVNRRLLHSDTTAAASNPVFTRPIAGSDYIHSQRIATGV